MFPTLPGLNSKRQKDAVGEKLRPQETMGAALVVIGVVVMVVKF